MFQAFAPRAVAILSALLLTACGGQAVETQDQAKLYAAVQASVADPVPTAAERAAQEAYLVAYEQAQSIELNRQTQESQARARMLAYQDVSASSSADCATQDASCAASQDTSVN